MTILEIETQLYKWRLALLMGKDTVTCIIEIKNLEFYLEQQNVKQNNIIHCNSNNEYKFVL